MTPGGEHEGRTDEAGAYASSFAGTEPGSCCVQPESPPRRLRTRSPRKAAAAALAAVPPAQQPLPLLGVCRTFSQDGSCKFGDRCAYEHLDANGKETPKPKAAAKPKAHAKKGARTPSPRNHSRRHSNTTLEASKQIPCKFFGTTDGCLKGEACTFAH